MATPEEPTFCYPIRRLENDRVTLIPFDPSIHAEPFVQGSKGSPKMWDYMNDGPFQTAAELQKEFTISSTLFFFAVFAKSSTPGQQETFAGVPNYLGFPRDATVDIGLVVLPAFQGTFVSSNAVGLLLQYALDQPPHGLGLRRVQWTTNAGNMASRGVAKRMGFTLEGIKRFHLVVPHGRPGNGIEVPRGPDVVGRELGPSRDTAVYAHYCDEWEAKRPEVVRVMERP